MSTKKQNFCYVLRVCESDMTSYMGFKWPRRGMVEAHDWDPIPHCGGGLHGWLNGEGNAYSAGPQNLLNITLKWLVVKVLTSDIVDLKGKVKFPRGQVIFCGSREKATEFLTKKIGKGFAVIGGTSVAGNYGVAVTGDYGTATAGNFGTAKVGHDGTATAGIYGCAIAGAFGNVAVSHYGSAIVGSYGKAVTGDFGSATAGNGGCASAGVGGTLVIKYFDHCLTTGYIGEKGLLPNVLYRLDKNHKFVRAE